MTNSADLRRKQPPDPEEPKREPRSCMQFDRKNGKRVRLDLGDGRVVWLSGRIVNQEEFPPYMQFVLDLPRSVRADREEVYLKRVAEGKADGEQ